MLLLLLLTVSESAADPPVAADWSRYGGGGGGGGGVVVQRPNRGFRFGGADRFSHGFGRRRRVNDVRVAEKSPFS